MRITKNKAAALLLALCFCLASCAKVPAESFPLNSSAVLDPTINTSDGDYSGEPLDKADGAVDASAVEFKKKDYYEDYEDGVKIALSDTANASGAGFSLSNGKLTVTADGTYVLSGKLSDGQITVEAPKDADVRLVLEGVDIYCSYSAPILVNSADKVIISLPEGYSSKLEDKNTATDGSGEEISAAVFSHESISINGEGALSIKAAANDGITSKDTLKIMGGVISIDAADDGIVGRDRVIVADGDITVNAVGDAIKSTNADDAGMGYIYISGGKLSLTCDGDAVCAETSMLVSGGELKVKTGGGADSVTHAGNVRPGGSFGGFYPNQGGNMSDVSAKGLKAAGYLDISGGSFEFDCADDAIHSNNTVRINNGKLNISTGDDGAHADTALEISGGEISIQKSYEGLEAQSITVSGGYVSIVSSDDGLNAAGGSDGADGGRPWQDMFDASSDCKLHITGGEIYVDASGDGIDSNGDITMDGGLLCVSGPTDNGNGYIDVGGSFYTNGGRFIAAGTSGMLVTPSKDSKQCSITLSMQGSASSVISVADASGTELLSWKCAKQFSCVTVSLPDIKAGEKYGFYVDGKLVQSVESTGTVTGGSGGGIQPGGNRPGGMQQGGDRPTKPGRI